MRDIIPEGQSYISFENNELEEASFELTGDSNWGLASDEVYSGIYSIRSGEIDHDQTSTIDITIDVYESGPLEYYYRVDAEDCPSSAQDDCFYDGLKFFVDVELLA